LVLLVHLVFLLLSWLTLLALLVRATIAVLGML
jgi:hypothetical protein